MSNNLDLNFSEIVNMIETRRKNTYSLEFLDLPNQYSEKDLKSALISNKKVLENKLKEIKEIVEENNEVKGELL